MQIPPEAPQFAWGASSVSREARGPTDTCGVQVHVPVLVLRVLARRVMHARSFSPGLEELPAWSSVVLVSGAGSPGPLLSSGCPVNQFWGLR